MLQTARVEPRPSRIGFVLLLLMHGSGLALLAATDGSAVLRVLLGGALALVAFWQLRHLGWFGGQLPLTGLACHAGGCKVQLPGAASGTWHRAELEADYVVAGWLMVINFRLPERRQRRSLVLLPDSAGPDEMRRLRALLIARKIPTRSAGRKSAASARRSLRSVWSGD